MDILSIHENIIQNIKKEESNISEYKREIDNLNTCPSIQRAQERVDFLLRKIQHISTLYYFYLVDVSDIITEYKKVLKQPVTLSFLDDTPKIESSEKKKITEKFFKSIKPYQKFCTIKKETTKKNKSSTSSVVQKCLSCKSTHFNENICITCGTCTDVYVSTSSYLDIQRISINPKYKYNRVIHFKECVLQYQGKENVVIEQKLYDDLNGVFQKNGLLIGDKNTCRRERYKNILKHHIYMFLKQLKYSKHYDNINKIYSKITNTPLPDIQHIETKIINDFTKFAQVYDKKIKEYPHIEKKKNTQYILYQLLHKHNYKCKASSFGIPKTLKRSIHNVSITKLCFKALRWNTVIIE